MGCVFLCKSNFGGIFCSYLGVTIYNPRMFSKGMIPAPSSSHERMPASKTLRNLFHKFAGNRGGFLARLFYFLRGTHLYFLRAYPPSTSCATLPSISCAKCNGVAGSVSLAKTLHETNEVSVVAGFPLPTNSQPLLA
jgi:hypothetical protein